MNSEKIIWDFLKRRGFNDYAVAGIMGNIKAESNLKSTNLQGSYEKKLGMNDEEYTTKVDNGSYTNFIHDSAGYGLCQWTYWSRKASLHNWCKTQRCSIGDIYMQLTFFFSELVGSYSSVYKKLLQVTSVREASDLILLKYEKPKDQGEAVQIKRAEYGMKYFNKYAESKTVIDETKNALSVEEIALEVISGKHGNGEERKSNLTKLGYDYKEVQAKVNEIMRKEK